jgi:hypothetical protein
MPEDASRDRPQGSPARGESRQICDTFRRMSVANHSRQTLAESSASDSVAFRLAKARQLQVLKLPQAQPFVPQLPRGILGPSEALDPVRCVGSPR